MATFKKAGKKNLRKRKQSEDSEDEAEHDDESCFQLQDIKTLQKLRERPKGVDAVGLALGKKIAKTEDVDSHDPFKMKQGGIVDMKALKSKGTVLTEEEKDAIGTSFAAETNKRDEDAEMQKFVEEELKRRKGIKPEIGVGVQGIDKKDTLFDLPENLKNVTSKFKKTEDMLSSQMLSGIPEIDLGIEAKIKNIEETEEAKQKLIQERMKKKDTVSEFVPTNMAVNFVQHNRFNIEETAPVKKIKKEEPVLAIQARVGDLDDKKNNRPLTVQPDEKATDNYHFDRFKRQMRR